MNHQPERSEEEVVASFLIRGGLALLVLIVWFIATANGQSAPEQSPGGGRIVVTEGASDLATSVHPERKPKQIP